MRVALYLKHFPAVGAPLIGGSATAVHGLAAGLAHNGADTVVLCEGAQRSSVDAAGGYRIECFPAKGRYRQFGVAPDLRDFVARAPGRPAVCLLHGIFHPSCFALARVLRRVGVPYVAIPQDPYDQFMFGRNPHLKWPYWFLFERRYLRNACAVQLLDRRHEAPLRRLRVRTPVFETPNGVDAGPPDGAPATARPPSDAASLLFLGRMDAYNKGLDVLLDAFARVAADAVPRLTLTLRGPDWGDRARLARRAAELALANRVSFMDPDYQRSPVELIARHDVLCLPSRFEGFGLVALEAMLAGRVLLVSERAGSARHVEESGCGVAVAPTVEGVAGGLRELMARRERWPEMGARGRRYVQERMHWNTIAADALSRYERLVA